MYYFALSFILVSSLTNILKAEDAYCYRDDMGMLHCNRSMEGIPLAYRAKVFFKKDPLTSSDTYRNNTPSRTHTQSEDTYLQSENNTNDYRAPKNSMNSGAHDTATSEIAPVLPSYPTSSNLPSRKPSAATIEPIEPLPVKSRNGGHSSNQNRTQMDTSNEKNFDSEVAPSKNNLPKAKGFNEEPIENLPEPPQQKNNIHTPPPSLIATEPQKNKNTKESRNSRQPKIEIFVAKWCPHCRLLEDYLKMEKLAYTKYDVEEDPYGIEVFNNEGGGIPITKIGDSTIVGYDEKKFKAIIESKIPY